MGEKAALVEQIKSLQRSDSEAKQAWWDHCDQNLGGARDPNRHDASVLQSFLEAYESGQTPSVDPNYKPAPSPKGGGKNGGSKKGGGKAGGGGGCWGGMGGGMMGGMGGMMGGMGAMPFPMGPPAAGGSTGDLADFIKAGQRSSPSFKNAWQTYCQIYGGGINDPRRQDPGYIAGFFDYMGQLAEEDLAKGSYDQPHEEFMMVGKGGGGGVKRGKPAGGYGGGPPGKRAAVSTGDAEKDSLVQRIKDLQRRDAGTKEAWWQYCDEELQGVRDPARHDKETLETFLSGYE